MDADGEVHNIASHHREGAYARGINKSGQVVGHAFDGAFIFERGELTPIGFIDDGHAEAMAINDQGQVVGLADTRRRKFHAFLWQEGSIIDLGTLGGPESQAKDINNDGQIVGRSYTRKDKNGEAADDHGFLWQDGKLLDLNDLIDPQSGWLIKCALGINDHGQIVGDARRNDRDHAVLLNPS